MVTKLKKIKRDENGLISGTKYTYTDNGLIDWRKMIRTEHLVPNRQKTGETDVTKLKDHELIILLGGIKELAQIRGYTDVHYDVRTPSPEYVVATCKVSWIPNYETEGKEVTFSAIGDASPSNTDNFAKLYLGPIAENRAFVRCVRNFLRINIVGKEELANPKLGNNTASTSRMENQTDPRYLLERVMKEKELDFTNIKKKLVKEDFSNAKDLESVSDIPKAKIFELIERIKKI
jgi:hypothetical protein